MNVTILNETAQSRREPSSSDHTENLVYTGTVVLSWLHIYTALFLTPSMRRSLNGYKYDTGNEIKEKRIVERSEV